MDPNARQAANEAGVTSVTKMEEIAKSPEVRNLMKEIQKPNERIERVGITRNQSIHQLAIRADCGLSLQLSPTAAPGKN